MGAPSLRAFLVVLFACLTLLVPRAAFASSAGIGNQWGFNSPSGCMICHTNGVGTPAAMEMSFSPSVLAFALNTTQKLTITVNVGTGNGAGINVTAYSLAGGAAAGTLSTCNAGADPNCAGLKTVGFPNQITHTAPHPKGAGNLVTFAFNYTAPANPSGGCYADKIEIWINNYNGNMNTPGDQAQRFDKIVSSSGFGCADDGNVCTTEACNSTGQCVHSPGNAGTVCRAAAGICDVAEVCNGTSATCPANGFVPAGTSCRPSAGICDVAESCTGSAAACPADSFAPSSTVCRGAVDVCDAAETCTGSSAACPPDGLAPAGTTCRAAAGPCDNPETCTGVATFCPPDLLRPLGTLCRAAVSVCDVPESCTGLSAACPADGFALAGTSCRASAGICDVAESCTGSSATCPADGFAPSSTVCRASAGVCDQAESCTGSAAACPADGFLAAGTTCRAAVGACDAVESCTGSSAACPANGLLPAGTVCRAAAGACDVAETCNGSSTACPADSKVAAGTVCRASAGACDPSAETCDGTNAACPANVLSPAGTVCSPASCANGSETHASTCSGASGTCPAPVVEPCNGYVCGGNACLTSCVTQADCLPGFLCNAGTCAPPFDLGSACTTNAQCNSGFCVDGVCCNRACTGQCEACNKGTLGAGLGTCGPVTGAPVGARQACANDGSGCGGQCNGVLAMACAYPGASTSCRAPSCANAVATLAAGCNGAGSCPAVQTQACAPYVCSGAQCAGDCVATGDAGCVAGQYCSAGMCVPKKPLGGTCATDNQCGSAHCVDGFCCDTVCNGQCEACSVAGLLGTCSPVVGAPVGSRPACAADGSACDGTCNGVLRTLCTYPGTSTVCRPGSCANDVATVQATCNGSGTCPALSTVACAPYLCDIAGVVCSGSCVVHADCQPGAYCAGGMCLAKLADGVACSSDVSCTSGHCVDGLCCDTACIEQCGACDVAGKEGTCSPVVGAPKGNKAQCATDGSLCGGTCDGSTIVGCAYPDGTVECRAASCANGTATLAASCDGQGACPPEMTELCGASGCGPTMCIGDCGADSECDAGEFCAAGVCTPVLANGSACGGSSQCASGFCVDGFCCDTGCEGQCEACNEAGKEGTCAPVVGGPHGGRPACGGSGVCGGTCDGKTTDACAFPGTSVVCGEPACAGGVATAAPTCKGDGTCGTGAQSKCETCEGNKCASECNEEADCTLSGGGCTCDLAAPQKPGFGALAMLALTALMGLRRRTSGARREC